MVRVLPDAGRLDRPFDYLVPDALSARVRVGTIVRIPLAGRRARGWVVADNVSPPPGVRLLPLAAVTGWGPPADLVDLAPWAARRWAGRASTFLSVASPPRVVSGLPPFSAHVASSENVTCVENVDAALAELAAEALAAGRAVLRLPPAADPFAVVAAAADRGPSLLVTASVAAAAALAERLRRRGRPVAHLPEGWASAATGGCSAVGPRAGAWAPLPAMSAVVVLEAHDEALKEERAPSWNAWEVAAERARRAGVPCVLVSPCPTLEQLDWGTLVVLSRSEERAGWPPVVVVDRRSDDPRTGLYSPRLVELVRGGRPVACILNRTGRARLLACAGCREVSRCEHCGAAAELVQAEDARRLACRRCGRDRPVVCQACGGQRLKILRAGVTRAREELSALAGSEVGEVTGATGDLPAARVLVGTEALLHRLPATWRGGAVAFLDFDQELLAPRYRAGEQALGLLARAARVVGPRGGGGQVLVQTRLPGHEVVAAAVHADPGRMTGPERERRRSLRLPPTTALALVSGPAAEAFAASLPPDVEVLGPDGGRFLVRAPDHEALEAALAATPRPSGRLRVEVDPLRA